MNLWNVIRFLLRSSLNFLFSIYPNSFGAACVKALVNYLGEEERGGGAVEVRWDVFLLVFGCCSVPYVVISLCATTAAAKVL